MIARSELEVALHQIKRLPGQSSRCTVVLRCHCTKSSDCQVRVGGGIAPNQVIARSELEVALHQIKRLPGQSSRCTVVLR